MRRRRSKRVGDNKRLRKVYHFLWDDLYEWFPENSKVENAVERIIERPVLNFLCFLFGHEIDRDQCGMPEHDFCLWCSRLFPYGADAIVAQRKREWNV